MWELIRTPFWIKAFFIGLGMLIVIAAIFSDSVHKRDFGLYQRVLDMLDYWKDLYIHWRIKRKLKRKWRDN